MAIAGMSILTSSIPVKIKHVRITYSCSGGRSEMGKKLWPVSKMLEEETSVGGPLDCHITANTLMYWQNRKDRKLFKKKKITSNLIPTVFLL